VHSCARDRNFGENFGREKPEHVNAPIVSETLFQTPKSDHVKAPNSWRTFISNRCIRLLGFVATGIHFELY